MAPASATNRGPALAIYHCKNKYFHKARVFVRPKEADISAHDPCEFIMRIMWVSCGSSRLRSLGFPDDPASEQDPNLPATTAAIPNHWLCGYLCPELPEECQALAVHVVHFIIAKTVFRGIPFLNGPRNHLPTPVSACKFTVRKMWTSRGKSGSLRGGYSHDGGPA